MASFNKVVIAGNLTRDVETRNASGTTVANVTVAVTEKYKTKSGENREDTAFIECTLWGRTAEIAAEYLRKGSSVLMEGKLKQDTWEDKQSGQKRSKLTVTVQSMQFLGSPRGGNHSSSERSQTQPQRDDGQSGEPEEVPF